MEFLCKSSERITDDDRQKITEFLTLDLWRRRELAVFLFTADATSSLKREQDSKLIDMPGSEMNSQTLEALIEAYTTTADRLESEFDIYHVDTSFVNDKSPSFKAIAYQVADRMIEIMHELTSQRLLVMERVELEGLEQDSKKVDELLQNAVSGQGPHFLERDKAETSNRYQQIVPYALLDDGSGKFFCAMRKKDHPRETLRGKQTILVGGHAEEKDWDAEKPAGIFEICLRRELDEELIGLQIKNIERVGVISDNRTTVGSRHLAVLFRVTVGGSAKIRRQAADQEFGREPVRWKSKDEIRGQVDTLDPWSQIVAAELFGAELPTLSNEPTLFTKNHNG